MSHSEINGGKHCQSCFTLENLANCSYSINFAKSERVYSSHGLETHSSWPLFRHSEVTAHLITERNTFMNDPGLRYEYKDCTTFLVNFLFIKDFCDCNRFQ